MRVRIYVGSVPPLRKTQEALPAASPSLPPPPDSVHAQRVMEHTPISPEKRPQKRASMLQHHDLGFSASGTVRVSVSVT